MEIEETSSGVSIAFPLGLALLVALLFFFCCFFCCCLHWENLQSLFPFCRVVITQPQTQPNLTPSHYKPGFPVLMMKHSGGESLPVLMPGDEVPRFIALACPCQPPTNQIITVHVHNDFCGGSLQS